MKSYRKKTTLKSSAEKTKTTLKIELANKKRNESSINYTEGSTFLMCTT
jgi:hypothetical protein